MVFATQPALYVSQSDLSDKEPAVIARQLAVLDRQSGVFDRLRWIESKATN